MATGELPLQTSSPTITIKYAGDHPDWPPRKLIKAPKGLLAKYLIEQKRSVQFFGEGKFTFSVAFAALRKSRSTFRCFDPWERILSTRHWQLSLPHDHFDSVKVECIKNSLIWHDKARTYLDKELNMKLEEKLEELRLPPSDLAINVSGYKEVMDKIKVLSEIPDPGTHWEGGHDALKPVAHHDVIWFQCPWTSPLEFSIHELIQEFMLKTADQTKGGELVCLGMTKHVDYVESHYLEYILGVNLCGVDNSTQILEHFTFLGADTELIADILSFGYRYSDIAHIHMQCSDISDIHDHLLPHHVTLVFERKKEESQKSKKRRP